MVSAYVSCDKFVSGFDIFVTLFCLEKAIRVPKYDATYSLIDKLIK